MGSVPAEEEKDPVTNDGGKVQSLLKLREIDEQFRSQLYSVHELIIMEKIIYRLHHSFTIFLVESERLFSGT
jgi:hypothetical protein